MIGKMVDWGELDYESRVDIEENNRRKGSVIEHNAYSEDDL